MSEEERAALLFPTRGRGRGRLNRRYDGFTNVSPGGGSWARRLNEYAASPPTAGSLDTLTRPRSTSRVSRSGREEEIQRRPYHYTSQASNVGQIDADPVEAAHYRRYQYYTRLQNQTGQNLDLLNIPDHVVPASFYQIHILGVPTEGLQGSLVTIFSIWNTMMGTSLLTMSWALEKAGLVLGICLMKLMAAICLYTAYRILQVHSVQSRNRKISEFADLCGLLLGRWAEMLCTVFSVCAILGAAIVYWVLMSNFLYFTGAFIHDKVTGVNTTDTGVYCPSNESLNNESINYLFTEETGPESTFDQVWGQYTTVPIFLILILFPIVNLKSATFFTKFNALGTVSILFILFSVLYRCYEWGLHVDFSDMNSPEYIPLYSSNFPSLTGILALGLFIHNAIITIMTNNKHQENNGRDMTIAYILVTSTYMVIGVSFYVSFPLSKDCIEDNLLNNFHLHDLLNVIAKIFLFFQMLTVFPLIMYLLRVTILYPIFNVVWPGLKWVSLLNAGIVTICVVFAIYMPKIGTIIRFSGALCGFILIFFLPSMTYMASLKRNSTPLTWSNIIFHSVIIGLGFANFVAQFFI